MSGSVRQIKIKSGTRYRAVTDVPGCERRQQLTRTFDTRDAAWAWVDEVSPGPRTTLDRIRARVIVVDSGCWLWQGSTNGRYGHLSVGGRLTLTHRAAWEAVNGPVPGGLELDHVRDRGCVSTLCCNPDHLEPVTHLENMRRRRAARLSQKVHTRRVSRQQATARLAGISASQQT